MKKIFPLLLFLGVAASGCSMTSAVGPLDGSADANDLADRLLGRLFNAYSNYTRPRFEKFVSGDFIPSLPEFLNGVERGYYGGNILEVNYFLNKTDLTSTVLSVDFRWEKKTAVFGTGKLSLARGRAEFVFREESGDWLLYEVRGQDPFMNS
jgi:hypothetical protein